VAIVQAAAKATASALAPPGLDEEQDGMVEAELGFQLGDRHGGVLATAEPEALGRPLNRLRIGAEAVVRPKGPEELPLVVGADPVILADRLEARGPAGIGRLLRRVGDGDADSAGRNGSKVTGWGDHRVPG